MSFIRKALRGPVQLLRKAAGQSPSPLETAIQFAVYNDVRGDYLEFGVYTGSSFAHAWHYYQAFWEGFRQRNKVADPAMGRRRFFAFDSFEGLPATDQSELPPHWRGQAAMSYSQANFLNSIEQAGVNPADVIAVPGFFDKSLTDAVRQEHSLTAAAIVHVDCDLYESTVPVLNFIRPILADGCTIVFDDWFYFKGHPAKGERAAFEQWLAKNPDIVASELCTRFPVKAFILNLRGA
jgi:O-methyltransferase